MVESDFENVLRYILKSIRINYNGKEMSGEDAFKQLTIDHDILGNDYIINYDNTPPTINIL